MASPSKRVVLDSALCVLILAILIVYAATLRNAGAALVVPTIAIPVIALILQMLLLAGSCRMTGCITRNDTGTMNYEAIHGHMRVLVAVALFIFGISNATVAEMHEELIGFAGLLTAVILVVSRACVRMNKVIQAQQRAVLGVDQTAFVVVGDEEEVEGDSNV